MQALASALAFVRRSSSQIRRVASISGAWIAADGSSSPTASLPAQRTAHLRSLLSHTQLPN